MKLATVSTPALLLDLAKFERNCAHMHERVRALGTRLRPHMKTPKSAAAARVAIDAAHGGAAVSTLCEADYFAAAGIDDLQLALCLPPDKLPQAAAIARRAPRFSFFLDSLEMAEAVCRHARAAPVGHSVWIEIDCGEHRTGVTPDDPSLLEIARRLAACQGVTLEGVATHAGHAYAMRSADDMARLAGVERAAVVTAAGLLRAAGIAVTGVSAGSTPTAVHSRSATGLTELRAGVFMAGDLFQAGIGSLRREEIALSVLATVISHTRSRHQVVVDAGGLALSKDRSTAALPVADAGYGLVLDLDGEPAYGDLRVADVHQEHGELHAAGSLPFGRLPIGAKVRILPNHACMTAAMFDRYLVVGADQEVVDEWDRVNGWATSAQAAR